MSGPSRVTAQAEMLSRLSEKQQERLALGPSEKGWVRVPINRLMNDLRQNVQDFLDAAMGVGDVWSKAADEANLAGQIALLRLAHTPSHLPSVGAIRYQLTMTYGDSTANAIGTVRIDGLRRHFGFRYQPYNFSPQTEFCITESDILDSLRHEILRRLEENLPLKEPKHEPESQAPADADRDLQPPGL